MAQLRSERIVEFQHFAGRAPVGRDAQEAQLRLAQPLASLRALADGLPISAVLSSEEQADRLGDIRELLGRREGDVAVRACPYN